MAIFMVGSLANMFGHEIVRPFLICCQKKVVMVGNQNHQKHLYEDFVMKIFSLKIRTGLVAIFSAF